MLTNFAKILYEADMRAAYTYMNNALELNESIDDLVSETEIHIKFFINPTSELLLMKRSSFFMY